MKDFSYAAAATVDEAVSLLAAGGDRARVLAGGTDILVQLREGLREADLLVDVKKVPELTAINYSPATGLKLGAAVPCYRVYGDARLVAAYPALCDAARIIGGWQIQSRASVGGNVCNSSPAADSTPALMVHGARCQIAGPAGTRSVQVADFCTAPGRNVLERGEFLVSLELPPPAKHASSHYLRFIPRNEMDIAVVGAGAWLRLDASGEKIEEARIALGAVAPRPLLADEASAWLAGKPANDASFLEAGELAKRIARPIDDKRGTVEYRVHLVGVLVRRSLAGACQRARGSNGKA